MDAKTVRNVVIGTASIAVVITTMNFDNIIQNSTEIAPSAEESVSSSEVGEKLETSSSKPTESSATVSPKEATPSNLTFNKKSGTFTGNSIKTRYGPVTVKISVANGKIASSTASEAANDNRSRQIASQAIPLLNQEVVAAQSVSIDSISGATFTSRGYISSLQSAIDKAGI